MAAMKKGPKGKKGQKNTIEKKKTQKTLVQPPHTNLALPIGSNHPSSTILLTTRTTATITKRKGKT
jgi:hypothetical protein